MRTAGAFVFFFNDKGYILLCKRCDKDLWNLPGGRIEDGESPWDAALREVKEEIGVSAIIEKLVGVYYKVHKDEVVFQFSGHITKGVPTTSDEVLEVSYFPLDSLPSNTAPMQVERIQLYAKDPTTVCFYDQSIIHKNLE